MAAVRALAQHPAFNVSNPNNCYSLFLGFCRSPVNFHAGGWVGGWVQVALAPAAPGLMLLQLTPSHMSGCHA